MPRLYRERRMRFHRAGAGQLEISDEALAALNSHRQLSDSAAEAGGLLLGRLIAESSDVVVDEATNPSVEDRRGRFFFIRWRVPAQRRVATAWKESGSTRIYLGEWHSHPEDVPSPS